MIENSSSLKRIVVAIVASMICCWAIWQAALTGYARTLATYAQLTNQTDAADRAVALSPRDAETHSARGIVLQRTENYSEACDEFERAVQLRPRDYYLWMMLGVTRDLNQDQDGALRALRQSVALAPVYAKPRWQLGNLLLRMGQADEAFSELRKAASSDSSLWPNVTDLAWGVYRGDPKAVVLVIKPETDAARLALAIQFASHHEGTAAIEQFRATRAASNNNTQRLINELLKAKAFTEAYEVWSRMRGLPLTNLALRNAGFEDPITVGHSDFGWQIPNVVNVTMSVDTAQHHSGARSLRIDFHGNSNPASPLLTQLVLVKPGTHYHLTLSALSKELVSAAAPMITVTDASDPKNAVLIQSPSLNSEPNVWRDVAIDFNTNAGTQAVTITLARQSCPNDPCPAVGTLWLDSFDLQVR